MKKIYALTLAFGVCSVLLAQRTSTPTDFKAPSNSTAKSGNPSTQMTPTDTLWGVFPLGSSTGTATPSLNASTGGGFIGGHNGYGDKRKVQSFFVSTPYVVEGICYWIGAKVYTSLNPTSAVTSNLYNMTGAGTTSGGPVTNAPNTTIAGTNNSILIATIDTSITGNYGILFVTLPTPYFASTDYGAGLDLTVTAAGDTVGLVHTADGEAGFSDQSWDQFSDNTWHSWFDAGNWGLNMDMAIFPVVNMSSGIAEGNFINGLKLYQNFPNPTMSNTTISFELEQSASNVMIAISDLTGKLIKKMDLKDLNAGKHSLDLDASEIAGGTYFVILQADNHRLGKKMNVVH